eukprot:g5558.t1
MTTIPRSPMTDFLCNRNSVKRKARALSAEFARPSSQKSFLERPLRTPKSSYEKPSTTTPGCTPASASSKRLRRSAAVASRTSNAVEEQAAMRPIIVCVDGNIGAGKSTLLNALKKSLDAVCFQESVEEWQNLLESFYADQKRWCYTLQSAILTDLRDQLCKIHSQSQRQRPYVIVERCPVSSWCFVGLHHQNGNLNDQELAAYERLTHAMAWEPDIFVYLRASPKTCHERCMKRNRDGESGIPLSYIESLHNQYESLIRLLKKKKKPVITLDAEDPLPSIQKSFFSKVHRRVSKEESTNQIEDKENKNVSPSAALQSVTLLPHRAITEDFTTELRLCLGKQK